MDDNAPATIQNTNCTLLTDSGESIKERKIDSFVYTIYHKDVPLR